MNRTVCESLGALLLGGGLGGGLYWLDGQLALAAVTGLCWACGIALTRHVRHRYPERAGGGDGRGRRWSGVGTGLVTLAALVGVSPFLPVSNELRLGLGLLVVGAGLGAHAAGKLVVLERLADAADARSATRGTRYSADDD